MSFRLDRVERVNPGGEEWLGQAAGASPLKRSQTFILKPLFDTFLNVDLTQVWGPASFGLPPPRTITFCTSPPSTTPPQTTPQASSNSSTPHSSRSTRNNPHNNSRVSCMSNDQDGQSKGELSNINPMNSYSVSLSSGSCSKENSAERRSWQMAFLQSVSQRGEKPQ